MSTLNITKRQILPESRAKNKNSLASKIDPLTSIPAP